VELNDEEQTILIVLELANIDIQDLVTKGNTPEGRSERQTDIVQASADLSKQFSKLWRQKEVHFDIKIDASTFNVTVRDEGITLPVPLRRRSTGFRWHVSFAWRFTYASRGEYKNCILLLEEPGVHLHPDGQKDLLSVLERLYLQRCHAMVKKRLTVHVQCSAGTGEFDSILARLRITPLGITVARWR
jgi:hypothetical protein